MSASDQSHNLYARQSRYERHHSDSTGLDWDQARVVGRIGSHPQKWRDYPKSLLDADLFGCALLKPFHKRCCFFGARTPARNSLPQSSSFQPLSETPASVTSQRRFFVIHRPFPYLQGHGPTLKRYCKDRAYYGIWCRMTALLTCRMSINLTCHMSIKWMPAHRIVQKTQNARTKADAIE
jgi:hypothetical protein